MFQDLGSVMSPVVSQLAFKVSQPSLPATQKLLTPVTKVIFLQEDINVLHEWSKKIINQLFRQSPADLACRDLCDLTCI